MELTASVIVRAKDKADTIGATLSALRAQSQPVEIIVVDSGSTDGTLDIARRYADVLLEIPPGEFTYGRALNLGARAASGSVHFALSAHCVPESEWWVADSLALYSDPRVAATNQSLHTPTGEPIEDVFLQTLDDVVTHPTWGFSNHASSWRADVWKQLPFREDLPACEDKEWSWRVLAAGSLVAYSPLLVVPTGHRRSQGAGLLYRRMAREAEAMVSLGAAAPLSGRAALRVWWSMFPMESRYPTPIRRVSPYRIVEIAGAVSGSRFGRPVPGSTLTAIATGADEPPLPATRRPFVPWFVHERTT
jgi:rhamnosyltransferase